MNSALGVVCGSEYDPGNEVEMAVRGWVPVIVLLFTASVQANAQDRFVKKLKLPTGETIVVAESDFEARSIGSFSVRLYEAAKIPDETTFFSSGLVRPRDGVVEKIMLADIDGDEEQEIIVVVRSVGTGGYLSAHTFAAARGKLIFRAVVEGLAADADPVVALRKSSGKQE